MITADNLQCHIPAQEDLPEPIDPPASVEEFVRVAMKEEQIPMPLTHRFSPGIYTREIFMPAGTFVIGHVHKTRHLNVILSGRARVMMNGQEQIIQGPAVIESEAGVQKFLIIEEDMRWMTIHANPEDQQDIETLENALIEMPHWMKELKGNMTVDEFRMSFNQVKELPV